MTIRHFTSALCFVLLSGCSSHAGTSAAPHACAGVPGEFHAQPLASGGLTRHYFLYVPAGYDCSRAWPLLIDFHGTAQGTEAEDPEEFYALPGMMAAADSQQFIVARPRSLYAVEGGGNIYQWDVNPGDLATNANFAHDLVAYLKTQYHLDPARVYASGFSNGTNMASQFVADSPAVFHGFATIGGGLWDTPVSAHFGTPPERVYATTGYREYMYPDQTALLSFLSGAGLSAGQVFVRRTDSAHEIYGWHYAEFFPWLDQGVRPPAGTLASSWSAGTPAGSGDDLLKIALAPDGSRVVSASNGDLWRQPAAGGTWNNVGHITGTDAHSGATAAANLAGMCIDANGNGIAVGNGIVGRSTDGGASWSDAAGIPGYGPFDFPTSEFFALACAPGSISGGGYTSAGYSTNGGASWLQGSVPGTTFDNEGFVGQLNTMAVGPSGTWVAGGYYDYLGRSTDGGRTFVEVDPDLNYQWFNGLAAASGGHWWTVGEAGAVFASLDDGQTWTEQTNPSVEDLYSVAFEDSAHGIAVGVHGAAVYTANGGATWQDVSTGLDGFLGDVAWIGPGVAMAVGENGLVLTFTAP